MVSINMPIKEIFDPHSAPIMFTVPSWNIELDIGALSIVSPRSGASGEERTIPMATKMTLVPGKIPVPPSQFGSYLIGSLIPNTMVYAAQQISRGIYEIASSPFRWAFNMKDPGENSFEKKVIDPFFDSLTLDPIGAGAGLRGDYISELFGEGSGVVKRGGGGMSGISAKYTGKKVSKEAGELDHDDGVHVGNYLRHSGQGRPGLRNYLGDGELMDEVIANTDFMSGVDDGLSGRYPLRASRPGYRSGSKRSGYIANVVDKDFLRRGERDLMDDRAVA